MDDTAYDHGRHLLVGRDGLIRLVRLAHVIDEPHGLSEHLPIGVILPTGHNQPKNGESWGRLILSLTRIAALFVAVTLYIQCIPEVGLADHYALPVISPCP